MTVLLRGGRASGTATLGHIGGEVGSRRGALRVGRHFDAAFVVGDDCLSSALERDTRHPLDALDPRRGTVLHPHLESGVDEFGVRECTHQVVLTARRLRGDSFVFFCRCGCALDCLPSTLHIYYPTAHGMAAS